MATLVPACNIIREHSSIMPAHLGGLGGLSRNFDTADAGEGLGGFLIKC